MPSFVLLLALFVSAPAWAEGFTHLECRHDRSTGLSWREGGRWRSPGMASFESEAGGTEVISFMLAKDRGILNGNNKQSVLVRVDDYFLEPTSGGNLTVWRYYPPVNAVPAYMIQLASVELAGTPSSVISAWKCRSK